MYVCKLKIYVLESSNNYLLMGSAVNKHLETTYKSDISGSWRVGFEWLTKIDKMCV